MNRASTAGPTPIHSGLPEEMVVWEILVRLPPKPLLRCRAVCRAWRHATSTRDFLQAHHARQPSLPVVSGSKYHGVRYENIFVYDHRAAASTRLQPIFRLEHSFYPEASCDGLLILSDDGMNNFFVCNPATRQHAPLRQLSGFTLLGMYPHRLTGEYRLLLRKIFEEQISCYVFAMGSDQLPRYIGGLETTPSAYLPRPAMVRDSLHWFPHYESFPELNLTGSKVVIVFDTTSESFRHMRAPVVPARSYIFEMDGTLGIYNYNHTTQIVDIWLLRNYESEVWGYKYNIRLPAAEFKERFRGWLNDDWYVSVDLVDGEVHLLVTQDGWMYHVDTDGKLVDNFGLVGQNVNACALRLKQTLVQHTFFVGLEGYDVNGSPFVLTALE